MKKIFLALLLLTLPTQAQYAHRANPGTPGGTASAITAAGSGNCPGSGCVCVNSGGGDSVVITIGGTWNQTVNFYGVNNLAMGVTPTLNALVFYPYNTSTGALSAGVTSTTANGTWQGSTGGFAFVCAYASVFTSNSSQTINIDVDPGSSFETVQGIPGGTPIPVTPTGAAAAASTPTTYAMPGEVVAQRPTTVATAPTSGNLTAATATSVFSSTVGICAVDVTNLSTTIAMTCGQTNAVSLTVGAYVPPLATYREGPNYGGNVFCFPASGTPAYSVQSTSCP